LPVPYLDHGAAERIFRSKVLGFLQGEGLMSDERARLLLSWNHNSGFSVDDSVRVEPEDEKAMERMARYMLRPPLSLERMSYENGADEVCTDARGRTANPAGKSGLTPSTSSPG